MMLFSECGVKLVGLSWEKLAVDSLCSCWFVMVPLADQRCFKIMLSKMLLRTKSFSTHMLWCWRDPKKNILFSSTHKLVKCGLQILGGQTTQVSMTKSGIHNKSTSCRQATSDNSTSTMLSCDNPSEMWENIREIWLATNKSKEKGTLRDSVGTQVKRGFRNSFWNVFSCTFFANLTKCSRWARSDRMSQWKKRGPWTLTAWRCFATASKKWGSFGLFIEVFTQALQVIATATSKVVMEHDHKSLGKLKQYQVKEVVFIKLLVCSHKKHRKSSGI